VNLDRLFERRHVKPLPVGDTDTETPGKRVRQPLKLEMNIPQIDLDDTDRTQLREALAAVFGGQASEATASPVPGQGRLTPSGSPLIDTHIGTLDQIAATHESVMRAALARSRRD